MQTRDNMELEYSRLISAAGELQADLRKCPDQTELSHSFQKQMLTQLGDVLTTIAVLQWVMGYPTAVSPSSHGLGPKAHASAAVALQPEIAGPITSDSSATGRRDFLGLAWEVMPWNQYATELPLGVAEFLDKCGRTLFRTKAEPRLYLVADYDPDVARLLACGVPELARAALRGVRNLTEEVGQAEQDLFEVVNKRDAGGPHVD